jgi:hypothetical protein
MNTLVFRVLASICPALSIDQAEMLFYWMCSQASCNVADVISALQAVVGYLNRPDYATGYCISIDGFWLTCSSSTG